MNGSRPFLRAKQAGWSHHLRSNSVHTAVQFGSGDRISHGLWHAVNSYCLIRESCWIRTSFFKKSVTRASFTSFGQSTFLCDPESLGLIFSKKLRQKHSFSLWLIMWPPFHQELYGLNKCGSFWFIWAVTGAGAKKRSARSITFLLAGPNSVHLVWAISTGLVKVDPLFIMDSLYSYWRFIWSRPRSITR